MLLGKFLGIREVLIGSDKQLIKAIYSWYTLTIQFMAA